MPSEGSISEPPIHPNGDSCECLMALSPCTGISTIPSSRNPETVEVQYFTQDGFPGLDFPYPIEILFGD